MSAERALADWLEHGVGLDLVEDDVFEAVVVLRPDLAPAPSLTADDLLAGLDAGPLADPELAALRDMLRPDRAPGPRLVADDILDALTAGPLAAASGAEQADAARLRARLDGGQVPAEPAVEEAINVVRPDLALPAATTAHDLVDALAPRMPSVAVAAPEAPRPANRSRAWWWPVVGTLAAAAAVALVVLQPTRMAELAAEPASAPAARGIDPALEADMPIAEIEEPAANRQAEAAAPSDQPAAPAPTGATTATKDMGAALGAVEDAKKGSDALAKEVQVAATLDEDFAGASAAGGRAYSSPPEEELAPGPETVVVGGAVAAPSKSVQSATTTTREGASSGSTAGSAEVVAQEADRRSKPKAAPKAPAQAPAAQAAPVAGPPPPPAPAADEADFARDADDRLYLEEDVVTRPEGLEQSTSDARADNAALSARVVPFAATKPSTDGLPEEVRAKVVAMWAAADRAAQSPSRAASLLVPLVADPDVPADIAAWTAARAAEYRRIAGDPAGAAALATDALARFPSAGAPRTALWLALGNARLALGDVAGAQAAWASAG
jgi:hypothetical protein